MPDAVHLLAADLRDIVGRLKRKLREEAWLGELSWPQLRVLATLDRGGPATVSALARVEGVRPQSMGETVTSLKAAGHIAGSPDPQDGRQTVLSLTPAGLKALKAARAAGEDWLATAIDGRLSEAEQKTLGKAVALLHRLV